MVISKHISDLERNLGFSLLTRSTHGVALTEAGDELVYTFDTQGERTGITTLLEDIKNAGITFNDLNTTQSSLEDIFVGLVRQR